MHTFEDLTRQTLRLASLVSWHSQRSFTVHLSLNPKAEKLAKSSRALPAKLFDGHWVHLGNKTTIASGTFDCLH